jgi:hypothetical protein
VRIEEGEEGEAGEAAEKRAPPRINRKREGASAGDTNFSLLGNLVLYQIGIGRHF